MCAANFEVHCMAIIENTLRQKLEAGGVAASFNVLHWRSVNAAWLAKECGFDWLFIDLEHNSMDLDTAAQLCVASLPIGVTPLVRVPANDYSLAARILDGGAMGVVFPHVDTAEQARRAVDACKYPPLGHRSMTAPLPQLGFATFSSAQAAEVMNRNLMVVVMLETMEAIDRAEEIAAVAGVDGLMIGTNDLAADMGIPGEFAHERIERAYDKLITACRNQGKYPGMGGVYDHDLMKTFVRKGVRFLLGGSDVSFVLGAGRARAGFLKSLST